MNTTNFKASLDTFSIILTVALFILFGFLGYKSIRVLMSSQGEIETILYHSSILILFTAILLGSYLFAPHSYSLSNNEIIINRPIKNRKINISDIEEVRIIPNTEIKGLIRTFGVGGVFGYFGRHYNSKLGSISLYATQRKNYILIRTKQGKKIVITPTDIKMFEKIKEFHN
jgi:hypothetical protein